MRVRPNRRWVRGTGLGLLLALVGCQGAPESSRKLGERQEGIRIANSLSTRALSFNALSTNPTALPLLTGRALSTAFQPNIGDPYLRQQLWDEDAQDFMAYVVGCALEAGHVVKWEEPSTRQTLKWYGALGLCPEWESGAPAEACLERVSACVVARSNAYGRRVELSLRGEDSDTRTGFPLAPEIPAVTYDPDTAEQVASFAPCVGPQSTASRDCGWQPDHVGSCVTGQTVRLGAGGVADSDCISSSLGSQSGDRMMLRVCSGLVGCDDRGPRFLEQSEGTCGDPLPAVTFVCPNGGYFNVMKAPYTSSGSGTVEVEVERYTPAQTAYPLHEKDAFRVREGAFYGTIFDPDALAANVYVVNHDVVGKKQHVAGSVYQRMFVCHDAKWAEGMAYATWRVCALPDLGSDCAATVTGACVVQDGVRANASASGSMCSTEDGALVVGDGDYERCEDEHATQTWEQPITVFLNMACDLDVGGLCERVP